MSVLPINIAEIKRASADARIALNKEEEAELLQDLQEVLEGLDAVSDEELQETAATFYGHGRPNRMRDDVEEKLLPLPKALANAPAADQFCFHVPRIIEE